MISIIAAISQNKVLGNKGKLPWYLPEDFKWFKSKTKNHPIIMGRTTFEAVGRALKHRTNIVLTSDENFKAEGTVTANSIEKALEIAKLSEGSEEIFIIGGAKIFEQTLDIVDTLYLTIIHKDFEGDTFFNPDLSDWYLVSSEEHTHKNDDQEFDYSFNIYDREIAQ